jgi:hypothetical protein
MDIARRPEVISRSWGDSTSNGTLSPAKLLEHPLQPFELTVVEHQYRGRMAHPRCFGRFAASL